MIWRSSALAPEVAAAAVTTGGGASINISISESGSASDAVALAVALAVQDLEAANAAETISVAISASIAIALSESASTTDVVSVQAGLPTQTDTTGSGDDIRRKKWLEWGRKKAQERRRKGAQPDPVVIPRETQPATEVAAPIQVVDTGRNAVSRALLAANLAAIRAQQAEQDRIAATVSELRDLVAEARAQDEEEAEMLLIGW